MRGGIALRSAPLAIDGCSRLGRNRFGCSRLRGDGFGRNGFGGAVLGRWFGRSGGRQVEFPNHLVFLLLKPLTESDLRGALGQHNH